MEGKRFRGVFLSSGSSLIFLDGDSAVTDLGSPRISTEEEDPRVLTVVSLFISLGFSFDFILLPSMLRRRIKLYKTNIEGGGVSFVKSMISSSSLSSLCKGKYAVEEEEEDMKEGKKLQFLGVQFQVRRAVKLEFVLAIKEY